MMYSARDIIFHLLGLVSTLLLVRVRADSSAGTINPNIVYPSSLTWGGLCIVGQRQSPVNVVVPATVTDASLRRLQTTWVKESHGKLVIDDGSVKFYMSDTGFNASTVMVDDMPMYLQEFHFHSYSEHLIDGKMYPLEAHFVHRNRAGTRSAVIVLFFHLSANDNSFLTSLFNRATVLSTNVECAPVNGNCLMDMDGVEVDMYNPGFAGVVKTDASYFRYGGSLTAPPCTEDVTWLIMKDSVGVSTLQLAQYQLVLFAAQGGAGQAGNRLPQPLNARTVRVYNAPGSVAVGDACDCPACNCGAYNGAPRQGALALPLWASLALLLCTLAASYKLLL